MEQQIFEGTLEEILRRSPELASRRVRVTILANETQEPPGPKNLAEALEGRIGLVSFQPSDLSERTGEAFAALLKADHDNLSREADDAR